VTELAACPLTPTGMDKSDVHESVKIILQKNSTMTVETQPSHKKTGLDGRRGGEG
jgi:hypothetical protein